MKKATVSNRTWLNPIDKHCMAVVGWHVTIEPHWNPKKKGEFVLNGEFTTTKEARNYYVERKADLRPLHKMQRELNAFISECENKLAQIKENNADVRSKKASS